MLATRRLSLPALPLAIVFITGCSEVAVTAVDVAHVAVVPSTSTILAGETMQLAATLEDGRGNRLNGRDVTWTTSDATIATVTPAGRVTGVGAGTASIRAAAEGQFGEATVTVMAQPVASVRITPATTSVIQGQSVQLSAEPLDAQGGVLADRALSWAVEDPTIASIDNTGLVQAIALGETHVFATSEGERGEARVTVVPRPVASVTITPSALTLAEGDTARLSAALEAADGTPLTGRNVVWTSADPAVAQVDADGKVLATGTGSTMITATSEGVSAQARVDVSSQPVSTVTVQPTLATVQVGAQLQLQALIVGANGSPLSDRTVTWSSSVPGVAAVDANGLVTGNAPGSAAIAASSEGVVGQAIITVALPAVASVTVAPASAALVPGGTQTFVATAHAADGTILPGRAVAWSSSDLGVATIDAQGNALAVASGTATISATIDGVVGDATVTVGSPPVPVATVTVVPSALTLNPGGSTTLQAEARAADGTLLTGRPTSWSSSDAAVASVDATGRVTAMAVGNATVTATVEGVDGTASVTVAPAPAPVASVTVVPSTLSLKPGGASTLTAEARAADGTLLSGRPTTWATSAAGVATVDATGKVTAVAAGTATITATVEGVTGSARVDVSAAPVPVASVSVQPPTATINEGDVVQLQAQPLDANGAPLSGRVVTWSSGNNGIATVNAQGRVTGVNAGTVTITATSEGVDGTATITVQQPVARVQIRPNFSIIRDGSTVQFQVELRASDGTVLTGKTVTWTTSDARIATIDANGLLTGRSPGAVTVTATSEGKTDTATVWVLP